MRSYTVAVLLLGLVGCREMDAATCPKGDYACVLEALDPEDVQGALMYAGPCYRAGRELCDRLEYCTGALRDPENCVAWWVENVCMVPQDPVQMNQCAELGQQLACEAYYDPDNYYARPLREFSCMQVFEHPLGGLDNYADPPPPGA